MLKINREIFIGIQGTDPTNLEQVGLDIDVLNTFKRANEIANDSKLDKRYERL